MEFVAFLRGVNVGGHKPVKMADLKAAFEGMGFADVRTVQASGNVVFDADNSRAGSGATKHATGGKGETGAADAAAVGARVEEGLKLAFGYPIGVAARPLADLAALVTSDPFDGVAIAPETRLYVTFLSRPAKSGTEISRDQHVRLVRVTAGEVLTVINLAPGWGTTELMAWLEKEFGPDVTTRNWNTVTKIVGSRR